MTAPSFINGEWVIPENVDEKENPEVILLKQFEMMQAVPDSAPIIAQQQLQQQPENFFPVEEAKQQQPQYVYSGPPHPLAQKGLEKLLQPPPDCESQLIQPKKLNLKRYSDSSFYSTSRNVFPTIDEQKQLCKLISTSLFSDENRDARGIEMFKEKLSKIETFSIESQGSKMERNVLEEYMDGKPMAVPEIPQAPIRTFLAAKALQEDSALLYTSNEFSGFHQEPASRHDGITPNQAFGLIQGLKESNRGAEIFEKRRQNADKWVVDETNVKRAPPRPVSPTINKMMSDLNRPLQESYAATVPAVAEVRSVPAPKPVDMSVDMSKIQDPIEILEMALKDKAPEEPPAAPASTASVAATVAAPDSPATSNTHVPAAPTDITAQVQEVQLPSQPAQKVTEPTPVPVATLAPTPAPTPAPAPAPEPLSQPAPASTAVLSPSVPAQFGSKSDLSSFMGQGPTGWKSIKPPGMKA